MNGPKHPPIYKRKRWIVLAVVAFILWYPVSFGPAAYFVSRNWLPRPTAEVIFAPIILVAKDHDAFAFYREYVNWCDDLGKQHRNAVVRR